MSLWLDLGVKSTLVALAGLLVLGALHRHSAAVRHLVVVGTLVSMALVVPLGWALPTWRLPAWHMPDTGEVPLPLTVDAAAASTPDQAPPLPRTPSVLPDWLALGWALGVVLAGFGLARGFVELRAAAARARPATGPLWEARLADAASRHRIGRRVQLLVADSPMSPATWGVRRPRVLLPPDALDWSEARASAVLLHELAHIRRFDWATQVGAEVLRAMLWFQPLAWVLARRLRHESELACDDAAIAAGVAPAEYAAHLVHLARTCRPRPTVAIPMARSSTLERRITAMLAPTLDRSEPSARLVATLCALWLLVTIPVAGVGAPQPGPLPLTGTVFDSTGAVLPDVVLQLKSDVGTDLQATTDAEGRFEFPATAAGRYDLDAQLAGFAPLRITVDLRRPQDWARNITLEVGTVRETIVISASRLPAPDQNAVAAARLAVRVGGNIRPPRKTRDVRPVYPDSMRAAGIEGLVPIEAIISAAGTVQSVRLLSASVHPELAIAAVDAVRQWQFEPTLLNGAPVDIAMTTTVTFTIDD